MKYKIFTVETMSSYMHAHARHVYGVHVHAVHADAAYGHTVHAHGMHAHAVHFMFYIRNNSDIPTVTSGRPTQLTKNK